MEKKYNIDDILISFIIRLLDYVGIVGQICSTPFDGGYDGDRAKTGTCTVDVNCVVYF